MTNVHRPMERTIAMNIAVGPFVIAGNLALIPLAIASVGAADYGAWMLCFGLVAILAVADGGVGAGLVRQLAHFRGNDETEVRDSTLVAGRRIFVGLSLAFGVLVPSLAGVYLKVANIELDRGIEQSFLLLAGIGATLTMLSRYLIAVQQSNGIYLPERLLALGGIVIRLVVVAVALLWWSSPVLVAASEVAAVAVTLVGSVFIVKAQGLMGAGRQSRESVAKARKLLLRQSLPSFVSNFSTLLAMNAPFYAVGAFASASSAVSFGAATRLYTAARVVLQWASMPLLPAASSALGAGEDARVAGLFANATRITVALGFLLSVPLVGFPDQVQSAWLGTESLDVSVALGCVGAAVLCHARYSTSVMLVTAMGRPEITAVTNLLWLGLSAVGGVVLVATLGTVGGALAILVPAVIGLELGTWRVARLAGNAYWRELYRVVALFVATVLVMQLARMAPLVDLPVLAVSLPLLSVWAALHIRSVRRDVRVDHRGGSVSSNLIGVREDAK